MSLPVTVVDRSFSTDDLPSRYNSRCISSALILTPEMSNQVLSCIVDPSDLSGLVNQVTISAGSIKFLIDNARMGLGAWACESSCFANNPTPDLQAGLGGLEIKAETIRIVACATPRLAGRCQLQRRKLAPAKSQRRPAHDNQPRAAAGRWQRKPLGLLSTTSGIPVCETASSTHPGQFGLGLRRLCWLTRLSNS
jgi:hypothetical protein